MTSFSIGGIFDPCFNNPNTRIGCLFVLFLAHHRHNQKLNTNRKKLIDFAQLDLWVSEFFFCHSFAYACSWKECEDFIRKRDPNFLFLSFSLPTEIFGGGIMAGDGFDFYVCFFRCRRTFHLTDLEAHIQFMKSVNYNPFMKLTILLRLSITDFGY